MTSAAPPRLGFPAGPEGLTAAALTDVLRAAKAVDATTSVRDFRAEPVGVGVGLLALLWRLTPTYEGGEGPASVILKLPATAPLSRFIADAFDFYRREVRFYEQLAAATPLGTARCLHAAFDPETKGFELVIEDLAGRTTYDQVEGCPAERADEVVRALAAHHATWWDDAEVAALDWTVRICDPPNPQALGPALEGSWPVIEAEFADLLPGPTLDAARRMPQVVVPLMEALAEPPIAFLHGDCRLDNLFFGGERTVTAVDWQICGLGRGPYDVAYFLSQSLRPEDRRAEEARLVRGYHETLVANGVEGYPFETCWEDYRRATLFVWVYPLNAGSVDLVNERAVLLERTMLERSVAAITDLDALELLP